MWYAHGIWHDIWHPGAPVVEKVVRSALVYLGVVVLFRIFGKRELGQSNTLDLVVLLLVANAVQNGVIGNDVSVTGALLGAVVLLLLDQVLSLLQFRFPWLERVTEGTTTTLISGGHPDPKALRRELISLPQLLAIARRQGFDDLSKVGTAILETNGTISMFKQGEEPSYHPDYPDGLRIGKRRRAPRSHT